jgi:ribosomal protein S19
MKRSKWKGPYVEEINFKVNKEVNGLQAISRNSVIIPQFVGKLFAVSNGTTYHKVKVTYDMLGHKFGEFSFTRKSFIYKKKLKKWDKK